MSWRTFRFFDFEELKDPDTNQPFDKLKDLGITCCTCGRGQMIFGDILLCSLHCTWFHLLGACSHLHRLDCVKWCTPSLIAGLVCLMKPRMKL